MKRKKRRCNVFTQQELNIIYLVLRSYSNTMIAIALNLPVSRVKSRLTSIYDKTKTKDRIALVKEYYENRGLFEYYEEEIEEYEF